MRIAGAIMLLAASVMLGLGAAGILNARVRELEMLITSLEVMERELRMHLTPLPDLLRLTSSAVKGSVKEFYLLCIFGLERKKDRTFRSLWSESAEAAQLSVSKQDLCILEELGSVLGRYDAASQCSAICATREKLIQAFEEAKERKGKMGGVYTMLGVAAGGILSIVLW